MSKEFIQVDSGYTIHLVEKPKNLDDYAHNAFVKWNQIKLYPYNPIEISMLFMKQGDKELRRYNFGEYKNVIIYSELEKFIDKRLDYQLEKIRKDWVVYNVDRSEIAGYKKFVSSENPEKHILLLPYCTFWALLERTRVDIAKEILNELHRIDFNRELEDDKNQTLIEQIKGEKSYWQHFKEQISKCETIIQQGVLSEIILFYPTAEVEKPLTDPKNFDWIMDLFIGNIKISLECDGNQHRQDNLRFAQDERKDTIAFMNGIYTFRRSNRWWSRNYKRFPYLLTSFLKNRIKEL